ETNDDDEESHHPRNLLSPASPGQPQRPRSQHQRQRRQRVHVELPSQENAPTHDEDAAAESLGHEHERSNPSRIDRRTRCTQTGRWPHASLRGLALTDILDRAESLYHKAGAVKAGQDATAREKHNPGTRLPDVCFSAIAVGILEGLT